MARLIKFAAVVIVAAAIWSVAGEDIKSWMKKSFSQSPATATQASSEEISDPNLAYWTAFWALYPEGNGFGSREAVEGLPIWGVTDSALRELHDVCIRYFDELEENHDKRAAGEEYLSDDLVRGRWASDFMPLIRRAKETYGTP